MPFRKQTQSLDCENTCRRDISPALAIIKMIGKVWGRSPVLNIQDMEEDDHIEAQHSKTLVGDSGKFSAHIHIVLSIVMLTILIISPPLQIAQIGVTRWG